MEKVLYLNNFLYYRLIAPKMPAFRKTPALSFKNLPDDRWGAVNFDNQTLLDTAPAIAPLFYKAFKPLTAAWFT